MGQSVSRPRGTDMAERIRETLNQRVREKLTLSQSVRQKLTLSQRVREKVTLSKPKSLTELFKTKGTRESYFKPKGVGRTQQNVSTWEQEARLT